jgi:hypothetical protein
LAQNKQPLQASLTVDLDLSKVKAKVQEANRLEEQAERRAENLKRRAQEIHDGLAVEESKVRTFADKFNSRFVQSFGKKVGKGALGAFAGDIAAGFEGGEGTTSFFTRVGGAALFAAPAGPQAAAVAAALAAVQALVEQAKISQRESIEIKRRLLEEQTKRKEADEELKSRLRQLETERRIEEVLAAIEKRKMVDERDYQTFRLMGTVEN